MGELGCGVEQRQLHFLAHIQTVPRVACGHQGHPQSPVSPQCPAGLLRPQSVGATKCGCPGMSWGRQGEPQLGSITWDNPFPLSIPSVIQKTARSGGSPRARGTPQPPGRSVCCSHSHPRGFLCPWLEEAGLGGCCFVPPCPSLLTAAGHRSGIKRRH